MLMPTWHHFGVYIRSRCLQDPPSRPNLVPRMAQEPRKWRPSGGSGIAQGVPRGCPGSGPRAPQSQEAPEPPQSCLKAPKTPQTSILKHFGNDFVKFSGQFYLFFEGFWKVSFSWHGSKIKENWIQSLSTSRLLFRSLRFLKFDR